MYKILGALCVALVLIIGGLFYYFFSSSNPSVMSHDKAAALILAYQKQNPAEMWALAGAYSCPNPSTAVQIENVVITGITNQGQNLIEANFAETDQYTPTGMACMHSSTKSLVLNETAVLKLYDNGWQVSQVAPSQI